MGKLKLIPSKYLIEYKLKQKMTLTKHFNKIKVMDSNIEMFDFCFSNAAVYSSMIEGNRIDFDSYLKYSYSGMNNKGKSFVEIEDLKLAYSFAKTNRISLKNLLKTHKLLSKTLIKEKKYQGQVRDKNVYVVKAGEIVYTGANKEIVSQELENLFEDISVLLDRNLSVNEIFYYASMLHLVFVKIHPFADGNGRSARLLEKWFLASKLGNEAWFIQSERLYQERIKSYYKNVDIGSNYMDIKYEYSLPFLLMLPMSLRLK